MDGAVAGMIRVVVRLNVWCLTQRHPRSAIQPILIFAAGPRPSIPTVNNQPGTNCKQSSRPFIAPAAGTQPQRGTSAARQIVRDWEEEVRTPPTLNGAAMPVRASFCIPIPSARQREKECSLLRRKTPNRSRSTYRDSRPGDVPNATGLDAQVTTHDLSDDGQTLVSPIVSRIWITSELRHVCRLFQNHVAVVEYNLQLITYHDEAELEVQPEPHFDAEFYRRTRVRGFGRGSFPCRSKRREEVLYLMLKNCIR